MPYNRYQSIQGYDPSPQEANWLGGMAYNPYSSGTDFGFALRNTLNNLLAHKQAREQASKEQQRYDEEQAGLARKEEFERRRLAVLERPEKPPAEPASITEAKALVASDPKNFPNLGIAIPYVLKIKPEQTGEQMEEETFRKARGQRRGAPLAPKPDMEKTIERQFNLNAIKDYTNRIRRKIDAIKSANYGNYDPRDPRLETLNTLNLFLHRRGFQERMVKGKMTEDDRRGLDLVGQFMEAESPSVDLTTLLSPNEEQTTSPITPPPAQESDPEEIQLTAREIMTRVAASGKQLSEEEAIVLAIQYLKSKQNVR